MHTSALKAAAMLLSLTVAACSPAEREEMLDTAESTAETAEARTEDAMVTAAVKSKLLADGTVNGMEIDVDTDSGVVTLTGTVETPAAKEKAMELARNTEGVTRVEDHLEVSP
jgi:osmotically-inducible protein OsmY